MDYAPMECVTEREQRIWRAGSGSPVIYLHGFEQHPGDASFLRKLAETRRVLAPEHPGHGSSHGLENIEDITDLVLWYRDRITSWADGPVDLIGHDLGGMFAAEIAALCPHLVRRLVLVAPLGIWLDAYPLPDPFVLTPPKLAAAKWANPALAETEPTSRSANDDPALFRQRNLGAATKFMWPIPDRGLSRRLPFVSAPTLIIQGEADGLVRPQYAEEFARLIPNAEVKRLPGVGHLPMVEAEADFLAAIGTFLAG